jgi:hypothetical protein
MSFRYHEEGSSPHWDEDFEIHKNDCRLQFIGYLITRLVDEVSWLSGTASLSDQNNLLKSIKSHCQYVTATGVEANHQQVNSPRTLKSDLFRIFPIP